MNRKSSLLATWAKLLGSMLIEWSLAETLGRSRLHGACRQQFGRYGIHSSERPQERHSELCVHQHTLSARSLSERRGRSSRSACWKLTLVTAYLRPWRQRNREQVGWFGPVHGKGKLKVIMATLTSCFATRTPYSLLLVHPTICHWITYDCYTCTLSK